MELTSFLSSPARGANGRRGARVLLDCLPPAFARRTCVPLICGLLGLLPEIVAAANGSAAADMTRSINKARAACVQSVLSAHCKVSSPREAPTSSPPAEVSKMAFK